MRNVMKTATLGSKFPLLAVENGCIISKDAVITVAYKVELPELFTLTRAEYEAMHSTWAKAVKVLPNYSIVHKQDFFVEESCKPDICKDGISFLSRSFERHFNERPYLQHTCYLFPDQDHEGAQPHDEQFQRPDTRVHHPQGNAGHGDRHLFHGVLRLELVVRIVVPVVMIGIEISHGNLAVLLVVGLAFLLVLFRLFLENGVPAVYLVKCLVKHVLLVLAIVPVLLRNLVLVSHLHAQDTGKQVAGLGHCCRLHICWIFKC